MFTYHKYTLNTLNCKKKIYHCLKYYVYSKINIQMEYNPKKNKEVTKTEPISQLEEEEGYILLKNNCYACHSVNSASHDAIIAPPMVAVVRRYKMSYQNKEAFVEAVTNWVLNPTEEHALMRGAVSQFKVMPKQPFNKDEIKKIADYMYENELEEPAWFQQHFDEENMNGMGKGSGKGSGKGKKTLF